MIVMVLGLKMMRIGGGRMRSVREVRNAIRSYMLRGRRGSVAIVRGWLGGVVRVGRHVRVGPRKIGTGWLL